MDGVRFWRSDTKKVNTLIAVAMIFVLSGCFSARPMTKEPATPSSDRIDLPAPVINDTGMKHELMQLSAVFEIQSQDIEDIDKLKGALRIHRDSLLWINLIHPGGIPVARGLFTPDSFFVQNRIDKEYYSGSYADFNARYQLPLNFSILQSVFLAEMIPDLQVAAKQEKSDSLSIIAGFGTGGTPHFSYLMQIQPDTLLKQAIILFNDKILEVNYENYNLNDKNLPQSHRFSIKEPTKTQNIILNFNKIETNINLEFPFQKQN